MKNNGIPPLVLAAFLIAKTLKLSRWDRIALWISLHLFNRDLLEYHKKIRDASHD